jgi:hypothetical protein
MSGRSASIRSASGAPGAITIRLQEAAMPWSIASTTAALAAG